MTIKTENDEIIDYLSDASCFSGHAEKVYMPSDTSEIIEIIKNANLTGEAITISAAGTGLTGSRVPLGGSILSMENFNHIINFSQNEKTIEIEPFVKLFELSEFLKGSGLFYPPNPTENLASLGGNIGNNASGSRTYKYGATRDYVLSLDVILPQGDTLSLERGKIFAQDYDFSFHSREGNLYEFSLPEVSMPKVKHAAGYFVAPNMDLIDLFIGAEGTLGVIFKIKLRLLDEPQEVLGAITFFPTHESMHEFLQNIKAKDSPLKPRLIEFFDNNSLEFLKPKISQIPDDAYYALWLEIETMSDKLDDDLAAIYQTISDYSTLADETWLAQTPSEHLRLAEFRHALPLAVYEKIQEYGQQKLGTDSAVPSQYFQQYHEFIIDEFSREKLDYVIWGHVGDSHLHANIITKTTSEFAQAEIIFEKILERAVRLGGTISAEHGIGKIKKRYLPLLYDQSVISGFRLIKQTFDPKSILNVGNIF